MRPTDRKTNHRYAAGAERFRPLPGQNDDAKLFEIDGKSLEQLHEVEPHLRVEGVRRVGPVQRDEQDVVVVPLDRDGFEIGPNGFNLLTSRHSRRQSAGRRRPY